MKQITLAYLLVLLLITGARTTAAVLPNGDFEDGDESWTVVGAHQAAQFTTERPAQGRISLRLQATEPIRAWAVSAPLQDLPAGPLELSMQARHISGNAELAVGFVAQPPAQPDDISPLWHIALPADNKWHRLQVGLVIAQSDNSPVCLALGLLGSEGSWQVDSIEIGEYAPRHNIPPGPSADIPAATAPPPLPAGWEPAGDLGAVRRRVGTEEEMEVSVDGLQISVTAEATIPRGVRHGLLTYVVNRGDARKQLTVSIQGPPGTFIPDYTVPIMPRGTTRFRPPVQALRTGDRWLKVTFSSRGHSAAMPIRLRCQRTYPAFGLTVKEPGLLRAEATAQSLYGLPVQFYHIPLTGGDLWAVADVISHLDAEVGLQLPVGDEATLQSVVAKLREVAAVEKVALAGLHLPEPGGDTWGGELFAQVQQSAEQIREAFPRAHVVSPPFSLTASGTGLQPSLQLAQALAAGLDRLVDSLAVRLPALPAGAVLEEQVDGRPRQELSGFWAGFDRHFDFAPLRVYINRTGLDLPLLLAEVGTPATGDRRLAALLTARLIIKAFAQGATSATILAEPDEYIALSAPASVAGPPIFIALQELSRELAGAVPLACLADTPGISGRQDCPVVYRVFRRGDEGILFMWNNTSAPLDVAVQLHCIPRQLHVVRLSYWGDFVTRQFQGLFSFSEEAQQNKQSAVYVRVEPLQIVGLTFNLKGTHSGWLRRIAPRPPVQPRRGPRGPKPHEDVPWWRGRL